LAGAARSPKIAVYGLSTEGYNVAARLGRMGYPVTLIDEVMQQAISLDQSSLGERQTISDLIRGERLVPFRPAKMAIEESDIIILAPRLKREGDEARNEMREHLRELGRSIKEGCHIVNLTPEGMGDGRLYLQVLSTVSGLEAAEKFTLVYAPKNNIVGSNRPVQDRRVLAILRAAGFTSSISTLEAAEAIYTGGIIRSVSDAAVALEMGRRNLAVDTKIRYIDDVAPQVFDARLLSGSLEDGDPLQQLCLYSTRILSSYPRYLAEKLKVEAKKASIRLSHTTAHILWDHDQNELRPIRRIFINAFEAKLRELLEEVKVHKGREYPMTEGPPPILIPCSKKDHEWVDKLPHEFPLLVANMSLTWFPAKPR
jgi:hypothetical protein